jgi:pyruvate kinase
MVKAGMNATRLAFSHGTHENHQLLYERIRQVEKETGEPITILQDLQGPKIRIGNIAKEGIELHDGTEVVFSTDQKDSKCIPIDCEQLHKMVKKGERMMFDDGKLEAEIMNVSGKKITARVTVGGVLLENKGVNLPDTKLSGIKSLTDKDKDDLEFGINLGVDMVAVSFVRNASDVLDVRYFIQKIEQKLGIVPEQPIRLIAKIEKQEGVKNIEEIMGVVDGIMVARGDLGVEIPAQEVPIVQKRLIDVALHHAKPVIVATQMLDSMRENPRPTRAEVSYVSNAVIDHTDIVMLSNETTVGKYPVKAVETMTSIIMETEKSHYDDLALHEPNDKHHIVDDTISGLSRVVAEQVGAKLILGASITGETGRLISRYHPDVPILVATSCERVKRQLNFSWGVQPFILPHCETIEELVERSLVHLKQHKLVEGGDRIVVVAGEPLGQAGNVNLLEVREIE